MSLYNYYYGITEQITPDEIENEYPEFAECSSCHDHVVNFVEHQNYIICEDCQKEQSHRNLDQIVYFIKSRNNRMIGSMNSIKSLCNEVLNPYK